MTQILRGNFPILATPWTDDGRFDAASHARLIDWLIDSGVHGLVMAANASEGHAQSDAERDKIIAAGMKRVAGRVPVIVTVTHFSTEVAIEKARQAEALGAAGVMSMPQFFGNWGADLPATSEYFHALADAIRIPVMVQDHPVSGVAMNAEFLARLASEHPRVNYFKLEFTQSPYKMGRVLAMAGKPVPGIFGGESGLYFIEEHERGSSGTMPACYLPRVFSETFRRLEAGDVKGARAGFEPYIPLLNFELRLANRNLWKCILKHLGVIASDRIRGPMPRYWDTETRRQCLDHVRRFDPAAFGVPLNRHPLRRRRQPAHVAAK